MTNHGNLGGQGVSDAHEAATVSAINGIVGLTNILRRRGFLSDADASALYESMNLPLGLPRYAQNQAVQDLQLNLDRLFALIVAPQPE